MNASISFSGFVARFPIGGAILYVAIVVLFAFTAWTNVADILARRQILAATTDILKELDGRMSLAAHRNASNGDGSIPPASLLLEGATITIGGANLLQRVASAVTRFGGNVLSTQVDLQGALSKEGFVGVTVSCEVEQVALQKLLYDLEAGLPFLFVDQLVAQGSTTTGMTPVGKLRVMISVSGRWQGSK